MFASNQVRSLDHATLVFKLNGITVNLGSSGSSPKPDKTGGMDDF